MATIPSISKADAYASVLRTLATQHLRFKPLYDFCHLPATAKSQVTVVDFPASGKPVFRDVVEEDLEPSISNKDARQLIIVENVSPSTLCTLGGVLNVDPQFFVDHIDAIPEVYNLSTTQHEVDARRNIIPSPWYHYGQVEAHVPSLWSLGKEHRHCFRYIAPREYGVLKTGREPPERMLPDLSIMNVERIGGLHVPVGSPKTMTFNHVGLIRQSTSIWFDKPSETQPEFRKGIILLDPPFAIDPRTQHRYGQPMASAYRPLLPLEMPDSDDLGSDPDSIWRRTCKDSLIYYLKHRLSEHPRLSADYFDPILLLEAPLRLAVSEFLVVGTYIERDLQNIALRLKTSSQRTDLFGSVLTRLFILQRRVTKYAALIEHIHHAVHDNMPASWATTTTPAVDTTNDAKTSVLHGMQRDVEQAKTLMDRNAEQISRTIHLLTTLINVWESEQSNALGLEAAKQSLQIARQTEQGVQQTERVNFLTTIAALALPFSTVSSILGMQTEFRPNGEWQAWLWGFSGGSVALISLVYIGYVLYGRYMRYRGHDMAAERRLYDSGSVS